MVMTRAKTAAWNFYMARINEMVERQLGSFQLDQPAPCLILSVPSKECVAVIESACRDAANEARNEAYGKALGPLVRAIDAIDNSPAKAKKSPEIRELYADLTGCYDALHKLWEGRGDDLSE